MGDLKSIGQWQNFLSNLALAALAGQPNAQKSAAYDLAQRTQKQAQGTLAQENARELARKNRKKKRKAKLGNVAGKLVSTAIPVPVVGDLAGEAVSSAISGEDFDPSAAIDGLTGMVGDKISSKVGDKVAGNSDKVAGNVAGNTQVPQVPNSPLKPENNIWLNPIGLPDVDQILNPDPTKRPPYRNASY